MKGFSKYQMNVIKPVQIVTAYGMLVTLSEDALVLLLSLLLCCGWP